MMLCEFCDSRSPCNNTFMERGMIMDKLLLLVGRIAGIAGFAFCLASGAARVSGRHWIAGFESLTLLHVGIAGIVLGCFCLLCVLVQNSISQS